jgi:TatA/E family protein of Tat protein translocase
MNEPFLHPLMLFIFSSPIEWIIVIAAVVLLFGANKLPEMAKSLGQARKEFKNLAHCVGWSFVV